MISPPLRPKRMRPSDLQGVFREARSVEKDVSQIVDKAIAQAEIEKSRSSSGPKDG